MSTAFQRANSRTKCASLAGVQDSSMRCVLRTTFSQRPTAVRACGRSENTPGDTRASHNCRCAFRLAGSAACCACMLTAWPAALSRF